MDELDIKLNQSFAGKVVRKDLTEYSGAKYTTYSGVKGATYSG